MKRSEKPCKRCKKVLPVSEFVNSAGERSSQGHYCLPCHVEREQLFREEQIRERDELIQKLQIVYGQWWQHYADPVNFRDDLVAERDFCLYCGVSFKDAIEPKLGGEKVHLDHMDPLERGGEHSIRNVVYCCGECNIKKGKTRFLDWLLKLSPKQQETSRAVYVGKHGHQPEDFVEGCPQARGSLDSEMVWARSLGDIKYSFPKPFMDGPPSNQPIEIVLDCSVALTEFFKNHRHEGEKG